MRQGRRESELAECEVRHQIHPSGGSEGYVTRDLCQGGVRFFVSDFIPKDSVLKIRITIEQVSLSFEALVKVRWIKKTARGDRYEVGAEFINIPQRAADQLVSYIQMVLRFMRERE